MADIDLPYGMTLREYQERAWDKFFIEGVKHQLLIWHRRAGKSKFAVNVIAAASQIRVGSYYYLFPQLGQARRTIWEGIGDDGKKFIDHFPKEIIHKVNNSDMKIEFKNGSIFRLLGTDKQNFEKARGSNPVGILYDEFAQINPKARDTLVPIIAQNNGWEIIISTPYGTNHMYELYTHVKTHKDWYVERLTVDDTIDNDGIPIVDKDIIESFREGGYSDDQIDQEFYCSFDASVRGAYFSRQLKAAESEGRIKDFPIDCSLPISTYWDLGISDATCIWVVQKFDKEIRCVGYYENNNESIDHYINWVHNFRDTHNLVCDAHFGPHDVNTRSLASGKSISDIAYGLGFKFERVPRIKAKQDAIEMARGIMSRCWFHKTNCKEGINCLRHYHKSYNDRLKVYSNTPVHDWSSHGCFLGNTPISMKNGTKEIKDVCIGDIVDIDGIDGKVVQSGLVGHNPVLEITLTNGTTLRCTKEHKIFTTRGVVVAGDLCDNDIVFTKEAPLCNIQTLKDKGIRKEYISRIGELSIDYGRIEKYMCHRLEESNHYYIGYCGKRETVPSTKGLRYTLLTMIRKIFHQIIGRSEVEDLNEKSNQNTRAKNLTASNSTDKAITDTIHQNQSSASCIDMSGNITMDQYQNIITFTILTMIDQITESKTYKLLVRLITLNFMQKQAPGLGVKKTCSNYVKQERKQPTYVEVQSVRVMEGIFPVYDLTIEKHNCYFADNVLVSNSDAFMTLAQTVGININKKFNIQHNNILDGFV